MRLGEILGGVRFFAGLPFLFRRPIDRQLAQLTLQTRLTSREQDLFELARTRIFGFPASPYLPLFELAGCELGDLERLLQTEGAEGALRALYRQGIYFTVEEFKGRRPVIRGSSTLAVNPSQFRNPAGRADLATRTSGSSGSSTPVVIDFASIRDQAMNLALYAEARGALGWDQAVWGVPGSSVLVHLLTWTVMGVPPVRWFTQVDPAASGLHPRYRWSARALRYGGLVAGRHLPSPEYVSPENPWPIMQWMAATLQAGRIPLLHTFASSGVRLARAVLASGLDLRGAQLNISGEPVTATRMAAIREAGFEAVAFCGASEVGYLGVGCLAGREADDLHAFSDLHVLVQPGEDAVPALPADALLLSSLRPTARLIMLNVSLGDRAKLERRSCGCPVERIGWTTHLTALRSFEKLTVGGMMLLDTDLLRILEELLPARFGGDPTCYQLIEDSASGNAQLRLLVHPCLGPRDEQAVADVFLGAIGALSPAARVLELQWRGAGLLQVERTPPLTSTTGKIAHLHRRSAPSTTRTPHAGVAH